MLAIARATHSSLGLARWKLLLVAAFFGIFAYNALVFVGLTLGPASDGAVLVPTLNPVLTVFIATFLGERLTRNTVAGIACATVGAIVVVVSAQNGTVLSSQRLAGDLLMVGGAACWSVYATIGAVTTRSGSPLGVTAVASLAGAAMLFPLGFLEHGYRDVPTWPIGAWLDIAYLVVFATIIGFVLFYYAVRRFGAGLASMVSYLVPVFALVQAVFLLGERPALLELVGGAIHPARRAPGDLAAAGRAAPRGRGVRLTRVTAHQSTAAVNGVRPVRNRSIERSLMSSAVALPSSISSTMSWAVAGACMKPCPEKPHAA